MATNRWHIRVPASSANLGAGFDCFALALTLYNTFTIAPADRYAISFARPVPPTLLDASDNLFVRAYEYALGAFGSAISPLTVHCDNQLPLEGGLGSSSTAVIAGISAAAIIAGVPLDKPSLVNMALAIEPHPDNLAACTYGGFVICAQQSATSVIVERIVPPASLRALVLHPHLSVNTEASRTRIPATVPLGDAVFNLSRAAMLVRAMHSDDNSLFRLAGDDRWHEQVRAPAQLAFATLRQRLLDQTSALLCTLSGSGPSLLVLVRERDVATVSAAITAHMVAANVEHDLFAVAPAVAGVSHSDDTSTTPS